MIKLVTVIVYNNDYNKNQETQKQAHSLFYVESEFIMRKDILTHTNDNLYEVAYDIVIVNAHFIDKYDESVFKKTFILDLSDEESSDKTVRQILETYAKEFNAYVLSYRVLSDINIDNTFKTMISE